MSEGLFVNVHLEPREEEQRPLQDIHQEKKIGNCPVYSVRPPRLTLLTREAGASFSET